MRSFRELSFVFILVLFASAPVFGSESVFLKPGLLPKLLRSGVATEKCLKFCGTVKSEDLLAMTYLPPYVEKLDLEDLKVEGDSIPSFTFFKSDVKEIVLPKDLNSIGEWAFAESSLERVSSNNNLGRIGKGCFYRCDSLKFVDLKSSEIIIIPSDSFYGCTALKSVKIPFTLQVIGNSALQKSGIEKLDIRSVTKIGDYGCAEMHNLNSIELNNRVSLGDGCFYGDSLLAVISDLPDNFSPLSFANTAYSGALFVNHDIQDGAFSDYKGERLILLRGAERIGNHAFRKARNLMLVEATDLGDMIPETSETAFSEIDTENITLQVAPGSETVWLNHPVWRRFKIVSTSEEYVVPNDSVSVITVIAEKGFIKIMSDSQIEEVRVYDTGGKILDKKIPLCNFAKYGPYERNTIVLVDVRTKNHRKICKIIIQ